MQEASSTVSGAAGCVGCVGCSLQLKAQREMRMNTISFMKDHFVKGFDRNQIFPYCSMKHSQKIG
jgi:hypothetical protein